MLLRKAIIAALFSLVILPTTKAEWQQTPISLIEDKHIILTAWCHGHKCHRHRHWHPEYSPYSWYHPRYKAFVKFCRHHPYKDQCRRFCHLNRGVCFY